LADADREYARTLWRCRRGTRELDRLLEGFVRDHYQHINAAARATLERLLASEDDQLIQWLLLNHPPSDDSLAQLCQRVRNRANA